MVDKDEILYGLFSLIGVLSTVIFFFYPLKMLMVWSFHGWWVIPVALVALFVSIIGSVHYYYKVYDLHG